MKKIIIPFLFLFLFIVSCNPWKYVGEADPDVDFTSFKTFGLLSWDPHNDKEVSPETKKYILQSIKHELETRGYVYKANGADLQVSIFILVNEQTSYSAYSDHYAGYTGYGAIGIGVGVGSGGAGVGVAGVGMTNMYPYSAVKHDYNVGAVVIDLLDHKKKKIVWQGLATGRLAHEQASEGSVGSDVARLFKTLPIKKKKR